MSKHVDSASDDRTANNAVRHTYRVLSSAEKAQMVAIKDAGAALLAEIEKTGRATVYWLDVGNGVQVVVAVI